MSWMSSSTSFKCEECYASFTSQQGLDQHEKYAIYRRKVAAGNNIGLCVCVLYIVRECSDLRFTASIAFLTVLFYHIVV